MKVGLYQFAPQWGDKSANLAKISDAIRRHPAVDLWILPELCTSGYQFRAVEELNRLAEPFPGGLTSEAIAALSAELHNSIILGVIEKSGADLYNSAVIFSKGRLYGTYRKIHLFLHEKKWFRPGNRPFRVYSIDGVRIGVMICFDWIFPEASRSLAMQGAQLIAHPANLVLPYCQAAMVTRSIENRVFTATANRIGSEAICPEAPLHFTGGSQITDPLGQRVGQLGQDAEAVLIAEIDPQQADEKMITSANDIFADRRSDLYSMDKFYSGSEKESRQ